jgi:ribosomal protein L11 methylase PrmA
VRLDARRLDLRREPLPWLGAEASPPGGAPVIVLANLLAPLLVTLAGAIATPPAELIAGGLLADQLDEAAESFATVGVCERARRVADGWGALWLGYPS